MSGPVPGATAYGVSLWRERSPDRPAVRVIEERPRSGLLTEGRPEPEDGFEKVALYAENGEWRHAAKLLEDGRWSSKLGDLEDVGHASPEDACGPFHGELACFMRRATRR